MYSDFISRLCQMLQPVLTAHSFKTAKTKGPEQAQLNGTQPFVNFKRGVEMSSS